MTGAGTASFPASFAQERLWFLDQLQPGLAAYNIARASRLKGPLDVLALERALGALVARHEALRTTFGSLEGAPVQLVASGSQVMLPVTVVPEGPAEDRERELSALVSKEAALPFDLASGPLWRARLYRLTPADHLLLLGMHHIVSDGWSLVVLFRELADLYAAYSAGRAAALPELTIQYADYAEWQREQLQGRQLEDELSYWRRKLHGITRLELPTDRLRPPLQTFAGGKHATRIAASAAERLRGLSQRQGASLFMTMLAAFKLLLSRHSGQEDVAVGTPIAGRNRPELEGLVGFFVNTLVLRTDLSGDPTFTELLARVRQTALEAYAHQEFPFEKLVEELHPERDQGRNPLFQVFVNMLSFGDDRKLELPGLAVERHELSEATAKFDLSLYLKEEAGTIGLTLVYNTDLFTRERSADLLEQYRSLLEQVAASPAGRVSSFDLVTETARRVLPEPRAILADRPSAAVHARVARPDGREPAPAVVDEAGVVSYADLHVRSNRLANYLRAHGIQARDVVAIDGRRGAPLVWSILAVLKAGAAFTILDPAHPAERRVRALRLALPKAWLELGDGAPAPEIERCLAGLPLLCRRRVSPHGEALDDAPAREPKAAVAGDALAYVAFTSGSEGGPKGILGTHRPLVHFLEWQTRTFGLTSADRFSMLSGLSHDPLLRDVFAPLWLGATLCIPDSRRMTDPGELRDWLRREEVSVAHLTPALARMLCQADGPPLEALRYVFLGGDRLTRGIVQGLRRLAPRANCVNFYGATETPQAIAYEPASCEREDVPIGRGIDAVQLLVLSGGGSLAGVGELGEIHVRTPYLSLGYLGDEALTRERFVVNPFTGTDGDRLYRSGDLGRYLPDGKVEFCGRLDSQLKIQGFRVEPGEVEATLAGHPAIAGAAVLARDGVPGDEQLVAYLLARGAEKPADRELRSFLGRSLPAYMVPRAFVWLDALPLTPNGKLDRRALPPPGARSDAAPHDPPSSATEELLAGIWSQLLGVSRVGVHDSFFELGGHSLLATQVMSRIRTALGIQLPLRSLFEAPTVAGLAARVAALQARPEAMAPPIQRLPRGGGLELSFAQQRLWFLEQIEPAETARLVATALELRGPLELAALRGALDAVVSRHDTLRTTFGSVDGEPLQTVGAAAPVPLPLIDLGGLPDARARLARLIADELQRPFDLARGPLLRAGLYRLAENDHVLLVAVHHIVSDGWSMGVLERELAVGYRACREGVEPALPPLPVQYADFARWQRAWLSGEALERQLAYWRQRLARAPRVLELPTDHPRPTLESHRGARHSFALPGELSRRLAELSRLESVTLFMTLLAGFQVLLARDSGQQHVVVGSPIAGRNRAELEGLIGLFVNTLVLDTDLSGDPSFREALGRVRETALGAYAHQELPFEKLVEQLRPERDPSRNPLFQVMFVLQNTPREELSLAGLTPSRVEMERRTSQFDLTLYMQEGQEGLKGTIEYSTALFESSTIERMAGHYAALLEAAVSHPERHISELTPLSEPERWRVQAWNQTEAGYAGACVHELIAEQARRTPARVALECGGRTLSYQELEQRSQRLARRLRRLGVGPEVRVAILLERSPELLVAVLGVLKAGGAYVPLDPAYPSERLSYVISDSEASLVLSAPELAGDLPGDVRVVGIEEAPQALDDDGPASVSPDNLAYVIYTSGSTGRPKGVSVTHRALVNLLSSLGREPGVAEGDVWLSVTTLSFDIAGLELYLPLMVGARVVLATRDEASDGVRLLERIEACGATVMQATPWSWRLLLEAGWQGTPGLRVLCGGEALSRELADQLLERAGEAWNLYGPTETTIWSTAWRIVASPERVSIGRPIANTRAYVLDRELRPLPVGVTGELCIAGDGLARGYWRRPEMTADCFVPDPFGIHGGRLYRTGDRARWLADGRLEHLGRRDQQVKLRGFRIELAEIESVLAGHPSVSAAAVLALEVRPGDTQLVAYVAHGEAMEPNVTELRAYLKRRLPAYMVPPAFVFLDELPLTANGKLDRKALAQSYDRGGKSWRAFVPPRTPTEAFIARLWQDVLGVEQVSVHDNFFDLGGHSLLAMKVLAVIERRVGRRINPREIIFQTLEQLAALCQEPSGPEPRARGPRELASRLIEAIRGAVVKGRALVQP